ncbi:prolipoprotein diacylglyceryl transferase [Microvirga rosea]|uniref:hypothetical protein n=1 Tax=Microvirga rosea TaxID=2715425 RepID=UPI001D09DFB0|nr:hypothetical protein [Microvirga rosea]MCB8819880.1 hypothetical protein [Microvirga rosea]
MNKNIWTSLGMTVLALPLMYGGAEARKVSYEINGKRYTYESTDPQQVESARKRIDAANAADAAKAKAEAEKASMPAVSVFGSQAQTEAAKAKAHLDQILAEPDAADAEKKQGSASSSRREARSQKPSEEQARAPEKEHEKPEKRRTAAKSDEKQPPAQPAAITTTPAAEAPTGSKPKVKSVSFDVESGIKTTIMSDGTIQEEPFDTAMLEKLASEQDSSGSLTEFVKQIRKVSLPEDTTGSTTRADALNAPAAPH